jgi:hypothetical protein
MPTALMIQPPISGHDVLELPIYSFIVENPNTGERVLFDLGLSKAWKEKQPPHGEFSPPPREPLGHSIHIDSSPLLFFLLRLTWSVGFGMV